ncbi:Oxidoreductase, aldo/keto reductase family [Alkalibacterium sp. AK22]|uniref:aldo/keto reductase n=1 Tax=Alkalibacterium sp. AK22 TaxID=1229520 RepID=UPI000447B105|nr:aldo/keto reductase [Alkalibacterium sp. AK22]EXJ23527.1 Oxidoreductase, aldo/keto reductase family [Alkalibacterium sp. AK22]
MKTIQLGKTGVNVSEVALGCMRMNDLNTQQAVGVLETAYQAGINFYDHADIYGKGASEEIFARALKTASFSREDIVLQSKAGIRSGYYDFSRQHLTDSVDGILKRLDTDYLDTFLLHRPDALVEPEEVAQAFDDLHKAGKVKHFGVSNHSPYQIELLKKHVRQSISVNQLQLSVTHTGMIDAGVQVNTKEAQSVDHDRGILDYCRLHDITIQPWSPVQGPKGIFLDNPAYPELNTELKRLAAKYDTNPEALAIAWLLRHPAQMQVVLGTMNPERLENYASASDITISREDWYSIYRQAGNPLP